MNDPTHTVIDVLQSGQTQDYIQPENCLLDKNTYTAFVILRLLR